MKILLLLGLACSLTIKRLLYLESLSPLKYSQFASPQRFDKRDENVQSSTINTTSFILNFKCNAPFRDFNFSKCIAARESLRLGLIELEKYIFLPNQVIIDATFESFCADKFNPGAKCSGIGSQVLGRAAPAQMIELNEFEAKNLGLDSNYGYPSSLIRQYVPDEMGNVTSDISANFNSDYNWLVAPVPSEPNWGSSVVIQGGFFNQSNTVSFDLRQVAVQ